MYSLNNCGDMRVSSWCRLPPEGGQSVSRRSTRRDTPHRSDTRPKHREKLDFQRLVDDPPWGGRGRPLPGFDAVAPVTRRWTSVFFGHPSSLCPFCLQRVTREREGEWAWKGWGRLNGGCLFNWSNRRCYLCNHEFDHFCHLIDGLVVYLVY